jgi:hypothetical protein
MGNEIKGPNDILAISVKLSEDIMQIAPASVDETILILELDFRLRKSDSAVTKS